MVVTPGKLANFQGLYRMTTQFGLTSQQAMETLGVPQEEQESLLSALAAMEAKT